jgi:orotidine-5'-phosphate decarboxylase
LVDHIHTEVGFVKFQSAYFEAFGSCGVAALANSIKAAKKVGLGVILDAKRGDIGSTAEAYARAYLTPASGGGVSDLEVDCLTINPFLGPDTLEPFVECSKKYGKGLFILNKTSNPGAAWLQDQVITGGKRVSTLVAETIAGWAAETTGRAKLSSIGSVVGATYPEDGKALRQLLPTSIFLAPGIGPQGGTPEGIAALAIPSGGGVLVPVSRGVTNVKQRSITESKYADLLQSRIKELKAAL